MWYVIQVVTGKETEVAEGLRKQGTRALVPRESRPVRSGGAWTRKEYVLFSGYVFLDIVYDADTYYRVRRLPGVIRFLGDGPPSRLSHLEAEWIMLLAGRDNEPVQPTVVRADGGGGLKVVSGVLERLGSRVVRYDRRGRRATLEVTVCGEKKEIQLGIELEDGPAGPEDADSAAPEEAAAQTSEEAD